LLVDPQSALYIWWGFFIPLLPAVFFLAPGLWRNVCPLAGFNQAPRRFWLTRGRTLPPRLAKYGFLIAVLLFVGIVITRKVLLNTNGTALSALLLTVFATAFGLGLIFKGKSG